MADQKPTLKNNTETAFKLLESIMQDEDVNTEDRIRAAEVTLEYCLKAWQSGFGRDFNLIPR